MTLEYSSTFGFFGLSLIRTTATATLNTDEGDLMVFLWRADDSSCFHSGAVHFRVFRFVTYYSHVQCTREEQHEKDGYIRVQYVHV